MKLEPEQIVENMKNQIGVRCLFFNGHPLEGNQGIVTDAMLIDNVPNLVIHLDNGDTAYSHNSKQLMFYF